MRGGISVLSGCALFRDRRRSLRVALSCCRFLPVRRRLLGLRSGKCICNAERGYRRGQQADHRRPSNSLGAAMKIGNTDLP
jgi:hypothetical protein